MKVRSEDLMKIVEMLSAYYAHGLNSFIESAATNYEEFYNMQLRAFAELGRPVQDDLEEKLKQAEFKIKALEESLAEYKDTCEQLTNAIRVLKTE